MQKKSESSICRENTRKRRENTSLTKKKKKDNVIILSGTFYIQCYYSTKYSLYIFFVTANISQIHKILEKVQCFFFLIIY